MKSRIAKPVSVQAASIAALIVTALSAGWMSGVSAQTPAPAERSAMHQKHRMEQMQMKMKERIATMASRLEIKASQQAAWADYVKARESVMANRPARPARDADAATIARARAEFAAVRARNAAVISDATAKLQAVLAPEQRKVFDEMAQRDGHRGSGGHHASRGEHGGRGGDSGHRGHGPGTEPRAPR